MSRQVDRNPKEKMLDGVNKLADPVASTIGARGMNVIIHTKDSAVPDGNGGYRQVKGQTLSTKDGVTVARSIVSTDSVEEAGIRLIREVSEKTVEEAGDGTSGSAVLTQYLMNEGCKQMKGKSHVEFCQGISDAVRDVRAKIKELSKPVTTKEKATEIATISANNDTELGELIGEVFDKIGLGGAVSVEEGSEMTTTYEVVAGMAVASGYRSHEFINTYKGTCVLEDPLIAIYSGQINTIDDVRSIMEQALKLKRPLLIISDVENEALETVIVNRRNGMPVCVVAPPSTGAVRDEYLRDISAITGVEYASKTQGRKPSSLIINPKVGADKVEVSKNTTKIIGGKGSEEEINQRKSELKESLKESNDKKRIKSRISMLEGGVARIIVGGTTTTEIKERKDRIDDAVLATQAAAEMGYVAGGGSTFRYISHNLEVPDGNDDYIAGYTLVLCAITRPEATIYKNSAREYTEPQQEYGIGFDAKTLDEGVNLIERGIIDPAKVLDCCIKNAAANTETFLKTEYLIYDL